MSDTTEIFDIPYHADAAVSERWGREVALDLYIPNAQSHPNPPIVVFIHGGAWVHRDMNMFRHVGRGFAERGIACACINYRLSSGENPVVHPTHTRDCADAVAWIYSHGEKYGYDANKLYVSGHSAGAHMTGMIALDPTILKERHAESWAAIKGHIGLSGIYDIDEMVKEYPTYADMFVKIAFPGDAAYWKASSPVSHAVVGAKCWLILHSPIDELLSEKQPQIFLSHLQSLGIEPRYFNGFQDKHFEILENPTMFQEVVSFIQGQ
eukprot:TRINITY_DN7219_c0_g1_i1.p1 TRINITY_DN7219_c0_g1~~TRINITY_DN7219_c0_g1_i1.p1  ORF type:complete len:266 (+),score=59.80 TRINITY_DN7219_c0_g1_i1:58-855(+)